MENAIAVEPTLIKMAGDRPQSTYGEYRRSLFRYWKLIVENAIAFSIAYMLS